MKYIVAVLLLAFSIAAFPSTVRVTCYGGKGFVLFNQRVNVNKIRIYEYGVIGIKTKKHEQVILADCIIKS